MTYTLLLDGQVLGETDLAHAGPSPAQRLGMLRPTPHGLKVLPSVAGFLTATLNLKHAMARRGLRDREDESDAMLDALENTPEGIRVRELAKMLEALELRDTSGQ